MRTVVAGNNQSLLDIAIQHCGSVEAAYHIALLNGLTLDAKPTHGQILQVPEVTDRRIVEELQRKGAAPGTAWNRNSPNYGGYYNYFALTNLVPYNMQSDGWAIPTSTQTTTLRTYLGGIELAGGELKHVGLEFWNSPNVGAKNSVNFNFKGVGIVSVTGNFAFFRDTAYLLTSSEYDATNFRALRIEFDRATAPTVITNKKNGGSVRLVRGLLSGESSLSDGIIKGKSYTDYEGNKYPIIKIGDQVWTAENLHTAYNADGTLIPEGINSEDWADASDKVWCAYDYDHNYL